MLEPWPEGQAAIEVLGYTNVRAFRWAGGQLSGWVHFDGEEKSRRESLDLQDGLTEEAHPRRAGQIIVAERAVEGKTGVVECWVWARLETDWVSPHVGKVYTAVPLTHHGFCSVHREPQASEPDETADEPEGPRIIDRKALSELSSGRVFQLWRGDPREVNQKLERILEAPDLLGDERFGPFLNVEVIPSQVHQEHAEPSVGADSR